MFCESKNDTKVDVAGWLTEQQHMMGDPTCGEIAEKLQRAWVPVAEETVRMQD